MTDPDAVTENLPLVRSPIFRIVLLLGVLAAASGPVLELGSRPMLAVIGFVEVTVLTALAWRLYRHPTTRVAVGLVAVAALLVIEPSNGSLEVLTLLAAVAGLGLVAGLRAALWGAAGLAAVLVVSVVAHYGFGDPVSVIGQGVGMWLLLSTTAGFGALARTAELARSVVARQQAELAPAHERLQASFATERELVLAQERARAAP